MSSSTNSNLSLFFPNILRSVHFTQTQNNGATDPENLVATNQEATMTVTEISKSGIRGIAHGVHIYIASSGCRVAGFELSQDPDPLAYVSDNCEAIVGDEIPVKVLVMRKMMMENREEFHAVAGISWDWVDAKAAGKVSEEVSEEEDA